MRLTPPAKSTAPPAGSALQRRARPLALGTLVRMAVSLVGAAGITSALGFVFWWVAARELPVDVVGVASASVSAMLLLGNLAAMGLGTILMHEIPRHSSGRGGVVLAALAVTGGVGVAMGAAFALVTPLLIPDLSVLGDSPPGLGIFALGVAATSVGIVLDQALIGMLRPRLQFWRNAIFAGAKLAALAALVLWFEDTRGLLIVLAWLLGAWISLGLVAVAGGALRSPLHLKSGWSLLRSLRGSALQHHALNVARFASYWVMPVVVAALISPGAAAAFYVALLVATLVYVISGSLSLGLFAVGAHDPGGLPKQLRVSLALSFAAIAVSMVGAVVFHAPVLDLFGPSYRLQASTPLLVLVAAAVFVAVKDHWIAVRRVRAEVGDAAVLVGVFAVIEIVVAGVAGSMGGLTALTVGWTAVLSLEAAIMSPTVLHAAMHGVTRGSTR